MLYSPVRERPEILGLALQSHAALEGVTERVYWDDNDDPRSSALLEAQMAFVIPGSTEPKPEYRRDETTHHWNHGLISRLATIRNRGIEEFLRSGADYLFMCDADMVFHPHTVERLIGDNVEINSALCWAKWNPGLPWFPNVWDRHPYTFHDPSSILRLKNKGVFTVGGTGTCYLFSRAALEPLCVNFSPLESLLSVLWGEDRFIAVRAEVFGIQIHVNTAYPSFHVYKPTMLPEATEWFKNGCPSSYFNKNWLTPEWEEAIRARLKPANG